MNVLSLSIITLTLTAKRSFHNFFRMYSWVNEMKASALLFRMIIMSSNDNRPVWSPVRSVIIQVVIDI